MKQWLRDLFSENSVQSMVRFLSLLCVVTASILAFIGVSTTTHSLESVSVLCGTFLAAGMGAKVLQKKYEQAPVLNSTLSKD